MLSPAAIGTKGTLPPHAEAKSEAILARDRVWLGNEASQYREYLLECGLSEGSVAL